MSSQKIGVIGIPGKWSTEVLADAIEARTGFRRVIDMQDVVLSLETGRLMHGDQDLCQLDALVVKKISGEYSPVTMDRLELLRVAESRGVRVFSPVSSMRGLINRLSCTVTLRSGGIAMPDTTVTESPEAALRAVREYNGAILKPLFSTKARGMEVLDASRSDQQLMKQIAAYQRKHPMLYIQKKLQLDGRDLGLVFLGGEYQGTYARVTRGDSWNTTIHSGGRYEAYQPDSSIIRMAQEAQQLFSMDFTTVDVAETPDGPIVFEVSAFGGFRGALEGAGIDAASAYAEYVMKVLA